MYAVVYAVVYAVYNNLHDSVNDKDEFAIEQRRSEYTQRKEEVARDTGESSAKQSNGDRFFFPQAG